MQAALDNLLPSIDAEFGGAFACATCHVLIKEDWVPKVGPPGETEESMFHLNPERQTYSYLACQIKVDLLNAATPATLLLLSAL